MIFSKDRDLLVIEPSVFADFALAGQQRVAVNDGEVSGTTLTSASADFEAAMVDTGSVVLISGVAHEVVQQVNGQMLAVSLVREDESQAAIAGVQGSGLEVKSYSFASQAKVVADRLLRMLGIDEDDANATVTAGGIVSVSVMAQLEVLGVLEILYLGAASTPENQEALLAKAKEYGRRFESACRSATVLFDLDGDGVADQRRQFAVSRLKRV